MARVYTQKPKRMSAAQLDRFVEEGHGKVYCIPWGTIDYLFRGFGVVYYNLGSTRTNWIAYRLGNLIFVHGDRNLPKRGVVLQDWEKYEFMVKSVMKNEELPFHERDALHMHIIKSIAEQH